MESLTGLFTGLLFILVLVGAILGTVFLTRYAIGPVERRAARRPAAGWRFRLVDAFTIALQCQVVLALGAAVDRQMSDSGGRTVLIAAAVFCPLAVVLGCRIVGLLNRAHVRSSARRATFILAAPASIPAAMVTAGAGVNLLLLTLALGRSSNEVLPRAMLQTLCWLGAGGASLLLVRLASWWVASEPFTGAADSR